MEKVDFAEVSRARLTPNDRAKNAEDEFHDTFAKMRQTAVGLVEETDLVLAAWLHRLGRDDLAATALQRARKADQDAGLAKLRESLAWSAFAGLVHAYMVRADEEALAHGERLLRLYAKEADKEYPQAKALEKELERRKKNVTFGHDPGKNWPEGFDGWDAKRKLAHLIEALDEVDARQWGQPGGVNLAGDRRVQELIKLGDLAVPDLIDTIEMDERLTRSVHFWRDFGHQRTVLGVREAALSAVMSILRVRVFEPVSTGDNLTARGQDGTAPVVARLRAYWKKYGAMPLDERMMQVLKDPRASVEATREAAVSLADVSNTRTLNTTVFSDWVETGPVKPNPAVAKYNNPTAAEAILAAMDRDLVAYGARPADERSDYERARIEDAYLSPLIQLGDQRIAVELAKRSRAANDAQVRRRFANAAHWLGDPQPLREFANDFRAGKIKPETGPEKRELDEIVDCLSRVDTEESDQALRSLGDPNHPLYAEVLKRLLDSRGTSIDSEGWFRHPFCLVVLRRALENSDPTGVTYHLADNQVKADGNGFLSSSSVPEILSDPKVTRGQAKQRVCDVAAEKLSGLVIGVPEFHVLLKDADERLGEVQNAFDRFQAYRLASHQELEVLDASVWEARFMPNVGKLKAPATEDDVKAGKAIFHLGKGSKLADLQLPASGVLKRHEKEEKPPRVLIVQAEFDANGAVTYGVIGRREILTLPAGEVVQVTPLNAKK